MANYNSERAAGREHIPLYPQRFVAVRILQLVLGIICLGLSAYVVSIVPIPGAALMVFTSIVTLLASIYVLVAHFGPPNAYNYWAILGLDIFFVIFWLISFGLLASEAAVLLSLSNVYNGFGYRYDDAVDILNTYGGICAAAAAVGAIEWIIYLIALIIHSVSLHRHRKAGLPAMPTTSTAPAGAPTEQKFEMQPQPAQSYYPPQPAYGNDMQNQQQPQSYYPPEAAHNV